MKVQLFTSEMSPDAKKDYARVVISNLAHTPNMSCPTSCMQASRDLARLVSTLDKHGLVNQIHIHINYVDVVATPPSFFKFDAMIVDYCDDEVVRMAIPH